MMLENKKMKKILFIALATAVFTISSCAKGNKQAKNKENDHIVINQHIKQENKKMKPTEMTLDMFKQKVMDFEKNPNGWKFEGDKPAIIDFYATWCGPCKATAPIIEELADEYNGKIDFYKVDVDQEQQLASLFGIRSIPSILFIPREGKPQMQVGAMDKAQFEEAIKTTLLNK